MMADILGKNRLRRLGFNIPVGCITARQAVMLNKAADVQTDTDDLFEHPLRELLGLDKQLRSIRGSLKVEVAKKVELEEHIAKERRKLEEFQEYPGVYDDAMKEDQVMKEPQQIMKEQQRVTTKIPTESRSW